MGWNDVEPAAAHPARDGVPRAVLLRALLRRPGRGAALRAGVDAGRAAAASRASSATAAWPARSSTPSARAQPARLPARGRASGPAMLRKRIIPCLDVSGGRVVKGVNFVNLRDCGEPVEAALRYAEQGADEIVWLNITATGEDPGVLARAVERAAEQIDVPLTVGGGVNRVGRVRELLLAGADKVSLNTAALARPGLIERGRGPLRLAVRRVRDRRAARARRRLARLRRRRAPGDRLGRHRLGGARRRARRGRDPDDVDGLRRRAGRLRPRARADALRARSTCRSSPPAARASPSTSPTRSRPAPRRRSRRRSSMTAPTRSRRRRRPAARAGCRCDERRSRNPELRRRRTRGLHLPGRRHRRRPDVRLGQPRGGRAHARDRPRLVLEPLARRAVGEGRDQRQRARDRRRERRLRRRRAALPRHPERARVPHRQRDLLGRARELPGGARAHDRGAPRRPIRASRTSRACCTARASTPRARSARRRPRCCSRRPARTSRSARWPTSCSTRSCCSRATAAIRSTSSRSSRAATNRAADALGQLHDPGSDPDPCSRLTRGRCRCP